MFLCTFSAGCHFSVPKFTGSVHGPRFHVRDSAWCMELRERILPRLEVLDRLDGTLDQDRGSRDRDEASEQDHQQGPGFRSASCLILVGFICRSLYILYIYTYEYINNYIYIYMYTLYWIVRDSQLMDNHYSQYIG